MSGSNSRNGTVLAEVATESVAENVGEKAVDRGLNAIIDFVKSKYGEAQVKIGTVFNRYLDNATQRYNQIRTLTTGTTPRSIIGEDSLYVQIGLNYNGEEIDTSSVEPLLQISKNLLILGTGGVGKSMLTRYLFLDTAEYEGYVPVLIELRRIGTQPSGELSILNLIYTCMEDFNVDFPRDQFEYSLQLGKYLFLFDGFDEVKASLAKETAEAIQKFSAKYPKNSFIVTSRPRTEISPLETFTVMESMPLNKAQAIDLASRIWTEDEIISFLQAGLKKLGYENVNAVDYLVDLRNVVCMIIKDGDTYRFSHRSFQAYFAACYTAYSLTDEQQKRLFAQILSGHETYWEKRDYYTLLMQIESERFAENALEDRLRELFLIAKSNQYPDEFFLRRICSCIRIRTTPENGRYVFSYTVACLNGSCYDFNILALFDRCIKHNFPGLDAGAWAANTEAIKGYLERICPSKLAFLPKDNNCELTFEEIDVSDHITEDDRRHFYSLIIQRQRISGIYTRVSEWLGKLDAKRASLKTPSFIDEL